MGSHEEAHEFCLSEEEFIINEGYKSNHKKFIYSFVDEEEDEAPKSKTTKNKGKKN